MSLPSLNPTTFAKFLKVIDKERTNSTFNFKKKYYLIATNGETYSLSDILDNPLEKNIDFRNTKGIPYSCKDISDYYNKHDDFFTSFITDFFLDNNLNKIIQSVGKKSIEEMKANPVSTLAEIKIIGKDSPIEEDIVIAKIDADGDIYEGFHIDQEIIRRSDINSLQQLSTLKSANDFTQMKYTTFMEEAEKILADPIDDTSKKQNSLTIIKDQLNKRAANLQVNLNRLSYKITSWAPASKTENDLRKDKLDCQKEQVKIYKYQSITNKLFYLFCFLGASGIAAGFPVLFAGIAAVAGLALIPYTLPFVFGAIFIGLYFYVAHKNSNLTDQDNQYHQKIKDIDTEIAKTQLEKIENKIINEYEHNVVTIKEQQKKIENCTKKIDNYTLKQTTKADIEEIRAAATTEEGTAPQSSQSLLR